MNENEKNTDDENHSNHAGRGSGHRGLMNQPLMPANLDAERSVLGAILLDNESYLEAVEALDPDDFSVDSHRRIYARMRGLLESGRSADMITLIEELASHKDLEAVGDVAYVSSLLEGVPERSSIAHYVEIVRDKAMLRRVVHLCNATLARIFEHREPALPIMADVEDGLTRIAGKPRNQARPLKDIMRPALDDIVRERQRETEFIGVPTGLRDLDNTLGGIRDGELWITGGDPGRGKTSFGIQFAINAVREGVPTVDFTLEMTDKQVVRRILAMYSPAKAAGARDPRILSEAEWHQVIEAGSKLSTLPLFVDQTTPLTLRDLRARACLYTKRFGIRMIVVDYLRLLDAQGRDVRERVTNIALGLAQLAKTEQLCVLALSQLSRGGDLNRVPDMMDLKESGDLEANAHVVLLLYRPLDEASREFTREDLIIIGKAREGPTKPVAVVYDEARLLFKPRHVE
jgi:replicative DNA helicase